MAAKSNFFDFRESLLRKPENPPRAGAAPSGREPITVAQLTADIERALKGGLPPSVAVKGELSNYNHHRGSGHHYFTMKDGSACIDCVMFKSDAIRLKFVPNDGMEVVTTGRVAVYAQRGRYQLYATSIQPLGQGALELAFQQMRAKLEAEGLFAHERKRELPRYPLHIALVTSTNTAAVADMLKVLRRFRFLRLSIYHVPVQGEGCGAKIAEAIRHLNSCWMDGERASPQAADVIVVGRGGGSLEDLWGFNEEAVARAIAGSTIPVITGIGHEVDVSIADLVADYHAHTPTEAAQVLTQHWRAAGDGLDNLTRRLTRTTAATIGDASSRLANLARHEFFRRPTDRVNQMRQRLDDAERQLTMAAERRLNRCRRHLDDSATRLQRRDPAHAIDLRRQRLAHLEARLNREAVVVMRKRRAILAGLEGQLVALSPESVLKRGYSITTLSRDGSIVRSTSQLNAGDRITTKFSDGDVKSIVEDGKQGRLFE
ncbi:MAG TPA: exodeoxyribonuclease VII large subunit [Tepidisphaeraceae bacterium]|jgi:exodeoxyribonuclease VII large subunit|nr:exodeoxyribonuclease VII large subunit [Tepidisphaeraceae bacterium]